MRPLTSFVVLQMLNMTVGQRETLDFRSFRDECIRIIERTKPITSTHRGVQVLPKAVFQTPGLTSNATPSAIARRRHAMQRRARPPSQGWEHRALSPLLFRKQGQPRGRPVPALQAGQGAPRCVFRGRKAWNVSRPWLKRRQRRWQRCQSSRVLVKSVVPAPLLARVLFLLLPVGVFTGGAGRALGRSRQRATPYAGAGMERPPLRHVNNVSFHRR